MDPITLAIVAALAKLSENVISDAYQALKAAIAQKCGVDSEVVKAIESVESKPDSSGRKETLKEEVANAKIEQNPELVQLANDVLARLKEVPGGQTIINQNVSGSNHTFSGSGDVTINK